MASNLGANQAATAGRAPAPFASVVRILLVEDDSADAERCLAELKRARMNAEADRVSTREDFSSRLRNGSYEVIVADYRLPGWTGLDALALRDQLGLDIPFILATETLGEDLAVQCIKMGVADYVLKEDLSRLPVAILAALKEKNLRAEKARAERAMRDSEAAFRLLFADNPLPMYIFDRETLVFLEVNEAAVRQYGYSREEFLRLKMTDVCPQGEMRKFLNSASGIAEFLVDAGSWRQKAKDGRLFEVESALHPFTFAGHPAGFMTVQDITEKLNLERQVRQAHKFEALGQMAGGIAHDFNNMTGAILGWAELGSEKAGAPSELGSYFDKIKKQTLRAAVLTRQLLAFARGQVMEPRPIDLNQSVAEVLNHLEKVIGTDISLQRLFGSEPVIVLADPVQLEQLLMNLCLNARDAMPEGGRLTVETRKVGLDTESVRRTGRAAPGEFALLRVTDSGKGMDVSTLERMFEPFFTTKARGKGTGLGLAMVYGIVRQHGGYIYASSEVDKGACFEIYLPLVNSVPLAGPVKPGDAAIGGGSETVLLAEDHEGLREVARECLARLGYRVLVATDGEEAVRLFEANREKVALVFLDTVLPKLSGPEAFEQMSRIKPDVRALFTTGHTAELADFQKAIPSRVAFLPKPYNTRDLAGKVREILDRDISA